MAPSNSVSVMPCDMFMGTPCFLMWLRIDALVCEAVYGTSSARTHMQCRCLQDIPCRGRSGLVQDPQLKFSQGACSGPFQSALNLCVLLLL